MEKITFDKRNYRKHSEQNKKRIRKSLTECGARAGIMLAEETQTGQAKFKCGARQ